MRLLLDEMHPDSVARSLRDRGFDVVAVTERADLRQQPDADLLDGAIEEGRVVVTNNVRDFKPLVDELRRHERPFPGIIMTNSRHLDRNKQSYQGQLLKALDEFLNNPPVSGDSWEWWI